MARIFNTTQAPADSIYTRSKITTSFVGPEVGDIVIFQGNHPVMYIITAVEGPESITVEEVTGGGGGTSVAVDNHVLIFA